MLPTKCKGESCAGGATEETEGTMLLGAEMIQVEWQALAVFGSTLGAALVAGAKLIASQMQKNIDAADRRHEQNRGDAREARDENRALSQAILTIQGKTVETLTGLQREIEHVISRLDRIEGVTGSKTHKTFHTDQ